MRTRTALLAGLVIALCAPALAAAQGESNLRTFRSIQREVLEYPHYTVFDTIAAQIYDGVVTLTGKVTMPYKRNDIEKRVSAVRGVKQVVNRIDVLPASKSDDELRVGIARAIYNNPTFEPYAGRANPPIHVIVERGRVTLQGVVTNEIERLLALSIARSFNAFAVTDELLTEGEAIKELEQL